MEICIWESYIFIEKLTTINANLVYVESAFKLKKICGGKTQFGLTKC